MNKDIFNKICSEVICETNKEYIAFLPYKKKTGIFNSKLGGVPYMPEGFNYDEIKNKNLCFLGQINFEELPSLDGFPEKGILQFFISRDENKLWGASSYKEYKVIYHENIDYSLKEEINKNEYIENFPVKGEYILKGKTAKSPITVNDYRFNEIFMRTCRKYIDTNAEAYWEIEGINEDEINRIFGNSNIRCGGSPSFIQDDIREYNTNYKDSVLLFEIPSILDDNINISWGDSGIANFFINKNDLKNRNFDNVLFSWDCY